jgi:hypothetical protein
VLLQVNLVNLVILVWWRRRAVKLRKRKKTLTPLSSLNPVLLNPRIEIEFGGLGVNEVQIALLYLMKYQLLLVG